MGYLSSKKMLAAKTSLLGIASFPLSWQVVSNILKFTYKYNGLHLGKFLVLNDKYKRGF